MNRSSDVLKWIVSVRFRPTAIARDHRLALGDWFTCGNFNSFEARCMIILSSAFVFYHSKAEFLFQTEILWSAVKTNCPTERSDGAASSTRTQDTFWVDSMIFVMTAGFNYWWFQFNSGHHVWIHLIQYTDCNEVSYFEHRVMWMFD